PDLRSRPNNERLWIALRCCQSPSGNSVGLLGLNFDAPVSRSLEEMLRPVDASIMQVVVTGSASASSRTVPSHGKTAVYTVARLPGRVGSVLHELLQSAISDHVTSPAKKREVIRLVVSSVAVFVMAVASGLVAALAL